MRRFVRSTTLAVMAVALLLSVGCESSQLSEGGTVGGPQWQGMPSTWSPRPAQAAHGYQAVDREPAQAERSTWTPEPVVADTVTSWTAYPTGHRASSALLVERSAPARVNLNESFEYNVVVTNLTQGYLSDVVVYDTLPDAFEMSGSEPGVSTQDGRDVTWALGSLEAGESRTIVVTGAATSPGTLRDCLTVTYVQKTCLEVEVVQPALSLAFNAPQEVLLCDPIPVEFVVTNTGTGTANNVVVTQELSEGLTTEDGLSEITATVGSLQPGESRTYSIVLQASQRGEYTNQPVATADGDLSAEASGTTIVREPVLELTRTAREQQFLGRNTTFAITVSNTGDGLARNTVLQDVITGGRIVEVSHDGQLDPETNTIVWNLGDLAAGDSREVSVTLGTTRSGTISANATVQARCAQTVEAAAATEFIGIPAILFELIDVEDPIEVGSNVVYVITATNQGTAYMTNVTIQGIMEDTMELVSAEGATALAGHEGNTITFEPLPQLAPREAAVWRVTIKAAGAGDVRFTSVLNSDQLTRDVEAMESTNFYE